MPDECARLIGIGEIEGLAIDSDDWANTGEDFLKLAAELAGIADDENAGP